MPMVDCKDTRVAREVKEYCQKQFGLRSNPRVSNVTVHYEAYMDKAGNAYIERSTPMAKDYRVHYRTGGTANFQWHETLMSLTYDEAVIKQKEVNTQGYPCYIAEKGKPLPTTYCAYEEIPYLMCGICENCHDLTYEHKGL